MEFINVSGKEMNTILPNDVSFFEKLHDLIQGEPDDYLGPEAKGMMAAIGIEKGKPFKPDARMKKILTDAAAIGNAAARAISFFPREPGNLIYGEDSAWMMAYANKDTAFEKNGAYNLDARALFHFGYICVSPAMAVTVAGKGSDYGLIALDSQRRPLDGAKTYKLHLPPNPPVKDFWALTLYDTQTRSQLQTDQQFPTLGSQTEGVQKNPDGSYDIYFAPEPPAGKAGNWLQTIPGKSWWLALRMYGPLEPWIDQTWRPVRATGLEAFLDTAEEDSLGSGATSLGPQVFAVFFKPFGGLFDLISPAYQHKFSIEEDDGRSDIHQGLIDIYFLKMSSDKQRWVLINPTGVLDYENNTEFLNIDVEVGTMIDKYFGTKGHSVYLRPGFQIGADRPVDGSLECGYKIIW
jgi:hypothetical protein